VTQFDAVFKLDYFCVCLLSTDPVVIQKTKLANGTTILIDRDTRFASVSVALCLRGGLCSETPQTLGVSHLLEHLLFKRTKKLNSRQIAERIDEFGADINAFTDAETLCLHGVVPKGEVEPVVEFLIELLLEANFTQEDLELEKEIVRQELLESEDDPSSITFKKFSETFWPDSILGKAVVGTLETIEALTLSDVNERLEQIRCGKHIYLALAGDVDSSRIESLVEDSLGRLGSGEDLDFPFPIARRGHEVHVRPFGQVHICAGIPWPSYHDEDFYAGILFSSMLGEGMSSRLFQLIREERGLTYDIGSEIDSYSCAAALLISGAFEKKSLSEALGLIFDELASLRKQVFSSSELERSKKMHVAQLSLEADSVSERMWRALESELVFGRHVPASEVITSILNVSEESLMTLSKKWLPEAPWCTVLVGDVDSFEASKAVQAYLGKRLGT
jgi:predicted Zn-dependent peptidase